MNNLGIKSIKLYEISCNTGLLHYLSLVSREYKFGDCIYILKCVITYHKHGVKHKKVFKKVFRDYHNALRALRNITIKNINNQLDLPF